MWQRLVKWNDDGWKTSATVSFSVVAGLLLLRFPGLRCALGVCVGVLYQQFIEWYGHMLQHRLGSSVVVRYFRMRHARHHKHPVHPHALQPLLAVVVAFPLMLLPALALWLTGGPTVSEAGRGVVAGFFFAYGALSVLHYDLHAEAKLLPALIRSSGYYRQVEARHLRHHETPRRYFCVSNPWFDDLATFFRFDNFAVRLARMALAPIQFAMHFTRRLE